VENAGLSVGLLGHLVSRFSAQRGWPKRALAKGWNRAYTVAILDNPIQVMLVDDEPDIRFMLRLYLGRVPGLEIDREAANGAEALELVRARCPEVVLLDIGMPVMDGIEATWHIKDACPHTKIIILSAFTAESLQREALARGADLYLEKTTPPTEIAAAVERLCRAA